MEKPLCFVISPIGEPESETRKRSDQVLKHIITPAVVECGYDPLRADQISEPGMITSQIIQHIVDDPLVVADLTDRNPNVFYELAVRHAIRKPLVQLIKRGEQIPFDVAGTRTIYVDHQDLDSVEEAKVEIINQIRALEKNSTDIESPISVSLDLQMLRRSEDPQERSFADLISIIGELHSVVAGIERKVDMQLSAASKSDQHKGDIRLQAYRRMRNELELISNSEIKAISAAINHAIRKLTEKHTRDRDQSIKNALMESIKRLEKLEHFVDQLILEP